MTAGDFGEGVKGLAEIFTEEVSAELCMEAVENTLDAFVGSGQGIVVTGVGDDDIILREGGDVGGLVNGGFESIEANASFGRDG